jgi:TRAP-type transport system small permease protein
MKNRIFLKAEQIFALSLKWCSVSLLLILFLLIGAGVFVRFVPITSLGWSDEIIAFCFAWMVFLGTAFLWRDRSHFRVELIPMKLDGTAAGRALEFCLQFLSLLFFLVVTYEGWLLAINVTDRTPILNLPKALWYMSVPISSLTMLFYTIRDIWLLLRGRSLG